MGNKQHTKDIVTLREKILSEAAMFLVPTGITSVEAWQTFEKRMVVVSRQEREIRPDFTFYLKIAASVLIIALAVFTIYDFHEVHVVTNRGEHRLIILPDHSTVLLNAGSALQYNGLLFAFTRKVNFNGEGFFTVQKGSRFKVISLQGVIEILGTQFNVRSRNDTYEVACTEGKVKVSNTAKTSSVILTNGLQTVLTNETLRRPAHFKSELISWKNGEFYFENASLGEVFKTLELQYNISIHWDDMAARTYTGYFTNKNLNESLKLVCLPLGLSYEISEHNEVNISTRK